MGWATHRVRPLAALDVVAAKLRQRVVPVQAYRAVLAAEEVGAVEHVAAEGGVVDVGGVVGRVGRGGGGNDGGDDDGFLGAGGGEEEEEEEEGQGRAEGAPQTEVAEHRDGPARLANGGEGTIKEGRVSETVAV